jgi:hypothetical protein
MSNVPNVNRDGGFAKPDRFKHSGGRPGDKIPGTKPIKVTGRDPRAGKPAKVKSPGRAHR